MEFFCVLLDCFLEAGVLGRWFHCGFEGVWLQEVLFSIEFLMGLLVVALA